MAAVTGARATAGWSLLAGALAVAASLHWNGVPDLGPIMPDLDGVHPVRAAEALHTAWAPGAGFVDKYPALGSLAMGAVGALVDPAFGADTAGLARLPDPARRAALWPLAGRLRAQLAAQRWLSRVAMGLVAALLAALTLGVLRRGPPQQDEPTGAIAVAAALVAAVGFGCSYPALYYADTTNVDALALLLGLGALVLGGLAGRWTGAAVAVALAAAVKDPAAVLAVVVLAGCALDRRPGRSRRLLAAAGAGTLAYALAAGVLTSPSAWLEHLRLSAQGALGVDRIDSARPGEWFGLLAYVARLLSGALGAPAVVLGLAGLGLLVARRRRMGWMLAGAVLATIALFVLPVGFVYVRFLLLPLAVLCVGAGVALAAGARAALGRLRPAGGAAASRLGAAIVLAGALLLIGLDPRVADYHRRVVPSPDARLLAAEAVPRYAPDGAQVVLFTDGREHGPPLDPARWPLQVEGHPAAPHWLDQWVRTPQPERPAALLWMRFPVDRPSGRDRTEDPPPKLGTRFRGIYELAETWGERADCPPLRSLTVRPEIMLWRRLPP
jgi:hypothetical protein